MGGCAIEEAPVSVTTGRPTPSIYRGFGLGRGREVPEPVCLRSIRKTKDMDEQATFLWPSTKGKLCHKAADVFLNRPNRARFWMGLHVWEC